MMGVCQMAIEIFIRQQLRGGCVHVISFLKKQFPHALLGHRKILVVS
jgi:hypothetical protein